MSPLRERKPLIGWGVLVPVLALWGGIADAAADPQTYRVQEGDTPASVAAQLEMPIANLLAQVGAVLTPGEEITVDPSGNPAGPLPSKYVETDIVVKRGQTLLSIADKLGMPMEELADFNGQPRRYHLMQPGETLGAIAERYKAVLEPIAKEYQASTEEARKRGDMPEDFRWTPETLLREWNDLSGTEDVPEGMLLTVGWEEPQEGDRIAYPLTDRLEKDVLEGLREANGTYNNGQAKLWNDNVTYSVYVVKAGEALEDVAKTLGTKVEKLRAANGLSPTDQIEEGQPLFVPSSASILNRALQLYACQASKDTSLRYRPDPAVEGKPVPKGTRFFVHETPKDGWYAALTGADDPKHAWAWIPVAAVDVSRERVYYMYEIPVPKVPDPPEVRPRPVAFHETIYPPRPVPPAIPGSKASQLLRIAYTYLGTPYRMGGESRRSIDCSAFVRTVMMQSGVWPRGGPRTALEQIRWGQPVPFSQLQSGDRLYFDYARSARSGRAAPGVADHTGIYIGGGKFIHATPKRARTNDLAGSYRRNFLGARRDKVTL